MSAKHDGTTAEQDGGFRYSAEKARSAVRWDEARDPAAMASPHFGMTGVAADIAWAMAPTYTVLHHAVRSERLDDADGVAPTHPRDARAFLFGSGDDDSPVFRVVGTFVNQYGDERAVVDSPAPWDTPDDMTPANEVVKSLEWEEAHYSFEETVPSYDIDAENVWLVDAENAPDLRETAESEGYAWTYDYEPSDDEETLVDLCSFLSPATLDRDDWSLVGGDTVTVRYESKQTGAVKQKSGTVTNADEDEGRFGFERDDGKSNSVKADGGEVGIYSSSRYPFMGAVLSVEVEPQEVDE